MIKIGILGGGLFTQKKLIPTYQKIPGLTTYVGTASPKTPQTLSYENILHDREISIVHIANAPHMHEETLINSIKNNKHIICEKPLCITYPAVETILKQSCQTHLQEGLAYRFHPQWEEILQIVASKELGKLQWIQIALSYSAQKNAKIMGHRNAEIPGSGIFWDLSCYPVDASLRMDTSQIINVKSTEVRRKNITIQSSFLLQFASGVVSSSLLDMNSEFHQSLRITFENGYIFATTPFIIPTQEKVTLRIKKNGEREKIQKYKNTNVYQEQLFWFLKKIQNNQPNDTNILQSAKILQSITQNASIVTL